MGFCFFRAPGDYVDFLIFSNCFILDSFYFSCLSGPIFICAMMELFTAVLSGDRTLELRIFYDNIVDEEKEAVITRRLCQLMDREQANWYG